MEVIALIVIGGLVLRFLGGAGGGNDDSYDDSYSSPKTKATDYEMRMQHLDNERRDREREAAAQRRNNR